MYRDADFNNNRSNRFRDMVPSEAKYSPVTEFDNNRRSSRRTQSQEPLKFDVGVDALASFFNPKEKTQEELVSAALADLMDTTRQMTGYGPRRTKEPQGPQMPKNTQQSMYDLLSVYSGRGGY